MNDPIVILILSIVCPLIGSYLGVNLAWWMCQRKQRNQREAIDEAIKATVAQVRKDLREGK